MGQKKKIIIIIKEYRKQVMQNPVAYHLLITAQPVPEQRAATPRAISPSFIADHGAVWNGRTTHCWHKGLTPTGILTQSSAASQASAT